MGSECFSCVKYGGILCLMIQCGMSSFFRSCPGLDIVPQGVEGLFVIV